jgi:energy-coupling factor transport system ATP-binding protein
MLNTSPFDLSTAQKQRVNIASVLMTKPRLLVVDEPTTGQDPQMRRELMAMMQRLNREQNVTVVVITHDMNLAAEYCERCLILRQGELILDGTPRDVFSRPEILSTTFLSPPQITLLSQQLRDEGFPMDALSVDELADFVESQMRGH